MDGESVNSEFGSFRHDRLPSSFEPTRFLVWKEEDINASYLNTEFYANNWIAFSLHFVSFISYFYIGHH
jgi:hypothetical protein